MIIVSDNMKTINYVCDICGEKRGPYVTPFSLELNDRPFRIKYRNVYRFKRIDLKAFISGKNLIEKYDICSGCLDKFTRFVQEQKSIDIEPEKDI